jgi:hypothetical protein
MLIKNIRIINEITDIENDSIDVCVESEDGSTYTVSIATTKNILQRMDQQKSNFSNPSELVIVVRKLTQEIITETLEAYAEDNAFWLKLYQFASEIDISVFDELQAKHRKESIEFDLLSGLDDLENEINKLDKLNNDQKSKLTASIEKLAQLLLFDSQEEKTNRDD